MKTYALLQDDVVWQLITIEDDQDINQMFNSGVLLVATNDAVVTVGMIYTPGANGAPGTFATASGPSTTKANLIEYAEAKQSGIAQGGFTVNANTTGDALSVSVSTKAPYDGYLSSAVQIAQLMLTGTAPTASINWYQDSGNLALTPQQVITVGLEVAAKVQATFSVLAEVVAAINAGTITTYGAIDAPVSPIAAWPVNS